LPNAGAEQFPSQNQNSGFIGITGGDSDIIGEYRLSYPSISDGEDKPMAQNGPFAIVVFIPDEGENTDQYTWIEDELTSWGYLVLIVEPGMGDWTLIESQLVEWNNGNTTLVQGSTGMFALSHIAVAGHGIGAWKAALLHSSGNYTIDGLFGLGLEIGGDETFNHNIILSNPSAALFLTGTTDEIAPAEDNVDKFVINYPAGWQVMHPLGANHLGYKMSDNFFERLVDGESTMGRSEQQNHAINHILPYLNLSLRGDDSAFQAAFNYENKEQSSDSDAYINEDLSRTRLYDISGIYSTLGTVMMNESFTIHSNVTMRNGDAAYGNVTCILPNLQSVEGDLENNTASCELTGEQFYPGIRTIIMNIHDHTFSDWVTIDISRVGSPLEATNPLPEVVLNQHNFTTMGVDIFAIDPDGVELKIEAVEIDNKSGRLVASFDDTSFTVTHISDMEWSGVTQLNLSISAGMADILNLTLNVTIMPVDDQVEIIGPIPQFHTLEDGDSLTIDLSQYVRDPEGENLQIEDAGDNAGLRISSSGNIVLIDPEPHWNGADLVDLLVSDGTTDSVTISVPINVEAVDDPIEFIVPFWSFGFYEDSTMTVLLSELVNDVDGDELIYSIDGDSDVTSVTISGDELIIAGKPNKFGLSQYNLSVSDGISNSSSNVTVTIQSVADLPLVDISSISYNTGVVSLLWTIQDPDGMSDLLINISVDEELAIHQTECMEGLVITCSSQITRLSSETGWYKYDVKVWDSHASQWSNTAFQSVEITQEKVQDEKSDSSLALGEWILPIGLGVVLLLLVGLLFARRN
jgi:hypothetical protein